MAEDPDPAVDPEDPPGPQGPPDDPPQPANPPAPAPADPPAPAPAPPKPAPPSDTWKPPSKEEWERVTSGLRDASGESRARKEKLRALEKEIEDLKLASATAEERAAKELERRLLQEADDRWRPKVLLSEARAALGAANCKDPKRWARLIDQSQLNVDADGEVTGLDEQVAKIRDEYPEAFKRDRVAPPEPQAAQPGSTRTPAKPKTATERQVAALLGKP